MGLQRLAVVVALIAEHLPAFLEPAGVADQHVPVVMADLMPEMAEQRAVRLAHGRAPPLALGVVGLGERHGDQPLVMPGQHAGRVRVVGIGQDVEDEAARLGPASRCGRGRPMRSSV